MRYSLLLVLLLGSLKTFAQDPNDTLRWRVSAPLTWDDFKGESIEGVGLSGEIFCMTLATWKKPNAFQKVQFQVTPVFDRTKSWVNTAMQVPQGLTYFQLIFNLYELHARKLRQELSVTKFGSDPTALFQEKYNASMTGLSSDFNFLRKETKLGSDIEAVQRWQAKIDSSLVELNEFAR